MKLEGYLAWLCAAFLVVIGWMAVFSGSTHSVDLALNMRSSSLYDIQMIDGKTVTLENGNQMQFVSMGNLKIGSPWRVLLLNKYGETIDSADNGQYEFKDGAYEIRFHDDKMDLFPLYPG